MTSYEPFPQEELTERLVAVRAQMLERQLDALIVTIPENIYYLTGLDHWGYFACHILIVPLDGDLVIAARAMEGATVANQVRNARFLGHSDTEDAGEFFAAAIKREGLGRARLGLEKKSLFLTAHIAEKLSENLPDVEWSDTSALIHQLRLVQSPLEQSYTRRAAAAADLGTLAAIEALRAGASDYEVAAECHHAMILAGSEYPGFGPFIRSTRRRPGDEHTTWRGDIFEDGDPVLLEIGAAYRKYQAPMGRLVYVGSAPAMAEEAAELSIRGMQAIANAVQPGATVGEVYDAWHGIAEDAGLNDYHRHHCGYLVGIGFPPSWTGGSAVTGIRRGGDMVLRTGMAFHLHSWFTETGRGDYFISNTALLTDSGCEILTNQSPETLQVR
ncbi:MAG: Xaa-Pro dipeptidase [Planctomycetota bacterium]|jgi:Xaa-Pro dipeptidase